MSTNQKPRELWILPETEFSKNEKSSNLKDHALISAVFRIPVNSEKAIKVIEYSAYNQALQDIKDLRSGSRMYFKESCEKGKQIKALEEKLAKAKKALKMHHNKWSSNDVCYSECTELCQTLAEIKEEKV